MRKAAEASPVWEEWASSAMTAKRWAATVLSSPSATAFLSASSTYGNVWMVTPMIGTPAARASRSWAVLEPPVPRVMAWNVPVVVTSWSTASCSWRSST